VGHPNNKLRKGHDCVNKLLLKKQVDQSLLKAGLTIPKKIQEEFLNGIGVYLTKGEKCPISIIVYGDTYEANITNVDFSEKYSTREVVQIRYAEKSPVCQKLREIFAYTLIDLSEVKETTLQDEDIATPDETSEYIEIYAAGHATIELKCFVRSAKADFLKYLGGERDLAGYQRSYKLVFYKCFFELLKMSGEVSAADLTHAFRKYYIDRKQMGLVADVEVDRVIEDIENSTAESVYNLIMRNPFNAISNHGFIMKVSYAGKEYFELNKHLRSELKDTDIDEILDIVDKKLKFYYSRIDNTISEDGPMRELINKILNEYTSAKQGSFAGHPMGILFRRDLPNAIYNTGIVNSQDYLITGSVGQGNWATVPWICIFDRSITTSAQRGVYIVYLLSQDGNSLYLTFNQGCTEISNSHSKRETVAIMQQVAADIRENINSRGFNSDNGVNLGENLPNLAYYYQKGSIFYKEYRKGELPSEDELLDDLYRMMQIYRDYVLFKNSKSNQQSSHEAEMRVDDTDEVEITSEIMQYGEEEKMSVKEIISKIKEYISAKGFSYEDGLIENFYLSLKSKPFVILAGTSGTGKTKLVKLFAEAVGATSSNGRYLMVSVRPDWSDSSDLFGHVDLNGRFIPGAIIDFVKQAETDNTSRPYFLCLDEMNLARVEYYLSDILSVIETREFFGSIITSEPLVQEKYYGVDNSAVDQYGTIHFPENLYIIGTVNMDETTFPFSKKVLDRANTIEFSYVDLMPEVEAPNNTPAALDITNTFLKTEYLLLAQCMGEETVGEYCSELQSINRILQMANAHVGYRVRDEIVFYLLNNRKADLLNDNEAMDNEIMQKILPRIQGSSATVKSMLCELFKHCAGDYEGYQTDDNDISSKMIRAAQHPECKYKKSAAKIAYMVRRYEEDGFTSYWL